MELICEQCGLAFYARPSHLITPSRHPEGNPSKKRYCSRPCAAKAYRFRMSGSGNPNFKGPEERTRKCSGCGTLFESYKKTKKFCTMECYLASVTAHENQKRNFARGLEIQRITGRYGGSSNVDKNQAEIVKVLRSVGIDVLITSQIGSGFPDLICGWNGKNTLLEVKNPSTSYGKKGLSSSQQKWSDAWEGSKPVVVYTAEEAIRAVTGS